MIILRMHQDFSPYSLAYQNLNKIVFLVFPILFILFGTNKIQSQVKPFVVVLDAGHGGHDSGNRGNGYYEKNIALSIALKIGKTLEKTRGFKIIYTRKTDVFVDLIQRARIANKADADLFVSIHCDAFTSSKAFGAGTFVLGLHENERNFKVAQKENSVIFLEEDYEKNYDGFNPNDPESVISLILMQQTYLDQSINLASTIQKSFVENLNRKDRTVKQAGFIVLKYTYMPSVLVETGFLTNRSEGAYLNSSAGQVKMASAIAKAIISYKNNRAASFETEAKTQITIDKSISNLNRNDIYFAVQISASRRKINLKSYNFKGLKDIWRIKSEKLYRYYTVKSFTIENAKKKLEEAKNKGYANAFIVAFDGDKKISITDAVNRLK
ncbi:MAG: N-acetylmuramoyl-L-alanine amidase [Flavobacteriaceae bacterium]